MPSTKRQKEFQKMEKFDVSVQRFDEFADEYASRFGNVSGYMEQLTFFADQIKTEKPAILELACGPGNVTKFLKSRFPESRILGVDLAPKMIELARKALPDVDFRVMDVRDISSIPEKFDAVMCSFCLPFLSKDDAAKLIADCSFLLNSGGIIYLSTMEGDEARAGFEKTSFSGDSEIYFNYHVQYYLESSFSRNGFRVARLDRQDYLEPDGTVTIDLIFIAEKQ